MQLLSACLVVAALLATAVNAQFQINTAASITQCVPTEFTWTGGQEPYFLAINPGGVPGSTALQGYFGITGTSFTWSANISSGTSIALELTDVNGEIAESAPVTIQPGASNSCLNSAQSSTSGPSETSTAGSADTGKSTTQGSTSITADTSTSNNAGASSRTGDGTSAGSSHTPGTSEVPSTEQPAPTLTTTTTDPTASVTFIEISNGSIAPMPTVSAQSAGKSEPRVSTGTIAAIATGIGAVAVLLATASFLYIKRRRNRGPAAHAEPFTGASRSSADHGSGDRGGPGMDDEDVVTRATSSLMARVASSIGDSSSAQDRVGHLPQPHRENISGGITASEKHLREFTQLRGRNRAVLTTSGGRNVNGQPRLETHAAAIFEEPISIGHGVERRRHPRHETDGGVRLEGGRPGEVVVDDLDQSDSMSEGSGTLPPPYASHFGDV